MHKSNINKKEIKLSLNFNLRFPNQIKQTTIFAIIYNGRKQIKFHTSSSPECPNNPTLMTIQPSSVNRF